MPTDLMRDRSHPETRVGQAGSLRRVGNPPLPPEDNGHGPSTTRPDPEGTPTSLPRAALALALLALTTAACRQDMHDQPKYIPLRPSSFFTDGRSARPLPPGTVARGHLAGDTLLYTGKGPDGKLSNDFPFPVTKAVITRGQERFNAYCSPCHDRTGNASGMVVRRGFRHPPSYHQDRLRQVPNGYIFDIITNGFGAMPDYSAQIPPEDRWAIVSYIRALQLSQHASVNDLPAADRAQLSDSGAPPAPAAPASHRGAQ